MAWRWPIKAAEKKMINHTRIAKKSQTKINNFFSTNCLLNWVYFSLSRSSNFPSSSLCTLIMRFEKLKACCHIQFDNFKGVRCETEVTLVRAVVASKKIAMGKVLNLRPHPELTFPDTIILLPWEFKLQFVCRSMSKPIDFGNP